MRALSAFELLSIWEYGQDQTPAERALSLLQVACHDAAPEALGGLTVGQRDAGLFQLRQKTFGSRLVASADCPACSEPLELNFAVTDVLLSPFQKPAEEGEAVRTWSLDEGECHVEFRLPTARDVVAAAGLADPSSARRFFLDSCLLSVEIGGGSQAADSLPAEIETAVVERMAELDPQAQTFLSLRCPACGHEWKMLLDIGAFFWTEIQAWARRILGEVHTLASAYGWREADILAMSPRRRRMYLEMASG